MLFVRRLRLIDSAEESEQWLARASTLWDARGSLAVRVFTTEGLSLGSTIPKTLRHYTDRPSWWGFSWVEQGEGEASPVPVVPTAAPAAQAESTSAVESDRHGTTPPHVERREDEDEGMAESDEHPRHPVGPETTATTAAEPQVNEGEVPAVNPSPVAESLSASSASGGDEDDFNAPEQRMRVSHGASSAHTATTTDIVIAHTPSVASEQCVPIDISGAMAEGGLVVVEVFSLNTGRVVATLPVDVSAAFRLESSDVQHYALIVTPTAAEAMDATAIHGVLDLTVVHRDFTLTQGDAPAAREGIADGGEQPHCVDALLAELRVKPLPVVPVPSGAIACSTTQLFFPSGFLRTSGAFLVSNVVVIESTADAPVTVEVVTSGGGDHCVEVTPAAGLTLEQRGERSYVVLSWSFVKPFTPSVRVHLLVRVGDENYPSVDFQAHGEPPRPGSHNPPYCFWINTTPVCNVPCGRGEAALMQSVLPVYKMLDLLAAKTDSLAGSIE